MQNKLLDILNNIGLESEYITLFKDANINRIIIDKKNIIYTIIIDISDNVDDVITNRIIELFKEKYKNINDVKIEYNILKSENNENIKTKSNENVPSDSSKITENENSNIIFGSFIKDDFVNRIDNIVNENENVVIEGDRKSVV